MEDNGEFLTLGHPFLDQLIRDAQEQGRVASLFRPLYPEDLSLFYQALSDPPILNGVSNPASLQLIYQPVFSFTFRISIMADLRREVILTLLADPENDQVRLWEEPTGLKVIPRGFRPLPDRRIRPKSETTCCQEVAEHLQALGWLRKTDYQLYQLYRKACRFIADWLDSRYSDFEAAQRDILEAETEKLNKYYSALIDEEMAALYKLIHKAAVLQVRVSLAKHGHTRQGFEEALNDLQKEIDGEKKRCHQVCDQLATEKGKRLYELKQKYVPKAVVKLISSAKIYLPRAKVGLVSQGTIQAVEKCSYDFHSKSWLRICCDRCARMVPVVFATEAQSLLCPSCSEICDSCGQHTSRESSICIICGQRYCQACASRCRLPGVDEVCICKNCADTICSACLNLANAGLEAGITS